MQPPIFYYNIPVRMVSSQGCNLGQKKNNMKSTKKKYSSSVILLKSILSYFRILDFLKKFRDRISVFSVLTYWYKI